MRYSLETRALHVAVPVGDEDAARGAGDGADALDSPPQAVGSASLLIDCALLSCLYCYVCVLSLFILIVCLCFPCVRRYSLFIVIVCFFICCYCLFIC